MLTKTHADLLRKFFHDAEHHPQEVRGSGAVLVMADLLEDYGQVDLATRLRKARHVRSSTFNVVHRSIHGECLNRGLLRWEDEPGRGGRGVVEFNTSMTHLDLSTVPVMTEDRRISRKDRAALLRQLLRQLGVPHVRVRTQSYGESVHVNLPEGRYAQPPNYDENRDKFQEMLQIAFPATVFIGSLYDCAYSHWRFKGDREWSSRSA
jgi:hypothetical protein